MPNQENSFRITVGEFSEEFLNDISRATYDYTIPLGLNNVLVGSGTLVNIDATPGILTAFGGVSGGGLWTFGITRRYGDPPGTEQIDVLTLAGVAFYELDPSSEKPALRCHGPRSVYEQALDQVRMWLHR